MDGNNSTWRVPPEGCHKKNLSFCNSVTARSIVLKFGMHLGVSLHVRTCRPRFCISGTARPIGFNFGVSVGGHELGA